MRTLLALVVLASGTLAAQSRLQVGATTVCVPLRADQQAAPWGDPWKGVNGPEDRWDPPLFPMSRLLVIVPNAYWATSLTCVPAPAPSVVTQPSPAPLVTAEPPAPAHSQTQVYRWPDSASHTTTTLNIILKDGTTRQALAVCVQDEKLTYVAVRGTGEEVALESVDLTATRRANAPLNAN